MRKLLCIILSLAMTICGIFAVTGFSADGSELYKNAVTSSDENWKYVEEKAGYATVTSYLGSDHNLVIPEEIDGKPVSAVGSGAFFSSEVEYVTLPSSVREIGWWAFMNCNSLKEIYFNDGLQKIDFGAFINCLSLQEVTIPSTVYHIDTDAFAVSVSTLVGEYDEASKRKVNIPQYYNNSEFVIKGYKGTRAEEYAVESLLTFESLGTLTFGDLDGDGLLGNADCILLERFIEKSVKLSDVQKRSSDLNCDGKVNSDDLEIIQSYLRGEISRSQLLPESGFRRTYDKLLGQSVYCDGDSVVKGTGTNILGSDFYSFATALGEKYGMKITNNSVSGTTLAKRKGVSGSDKSILERVKQMKGKYDIILLNGGFNDIFRGVKLGKVTPDSNKSGKYDEYTTAGAVESICYFLNKNYKNTPALFVICHRIVDEPDEDKYFDIIRKALDKWGVSYIDVGAETDFCNLNKEIADIYFSYRESEKSGDGVHPTAYAHTYIYMPLIERSLNELLTGGGSVSFASKEVSLAMGENYFQIPSYSGGSYFVNFKWSSSEPSIATVDDYGNVQANGVGTAYIRVEADDGSFAAYKLNVKNQPNCIFLSSDENELKVGETYQLREALPEYNASLNNTFVSTNPTVAAVDRSGVIYAKSEGTAKIVCKSCNGVMAECVINVRK